MNIAVYYGTKELYWTMTASAKSLVHYSNVDKIYFLIQDDNFSYSLPDYIECINISYLDTNNLSLIQAFLPEIFPEIEKILFLNPKVIINENISNLWDIDITNYYIGAVKKNEELCYDTNIALFNLKKIRAEQKDKAVISSIINNINIDKLYQWWEVLELPSEYNFNQKTNCSDITVKKIIQFSENDNCNNISDFIYYQNLNWEDINKNCYDQPKLDIIVTHYNNIEGLKLCLNSIYYTDLLDKITITVFDDASTKVTQEEFKQMEEIFPQVHWFFSEKNGGPGSIRNKAIENTQNPYIFFMDGDDIILSKYWLQRMLYLITTERIYDVHIFPVACYHENEYHGFTGTAVSKIYNRNFLKIYNIKFCDKKYGSYISEDVCFNSIVRTICSEFFHRLIKTYSFPVYFYINNSTSLTHKESGNFRWTQIPSLTENSQHYINIIEKNSLSTTKAFLWYLNFYLFSFYTIYVKAIQKDSINLDKYWSLIYQFYSKNFCKYIQPQISKSTISQFISTALKKESGLKDKLITTYSLFVQIISNSQGKRNLLWEKNMYDRYYNPDL